MRQGSKNGVAFGVPDRGKGVAVRSEHGRPCRHEGCGTILSTYNSSTTCWLHTDPTPRHPRFPD
jgi:hypothetical protein